MMGLYSQIQVQFPWAEGNWKHIYDNKRLCITVHRSFISSRKQAITQYLPTGEYKPTFVYLYNGKLITQQ